MDNTRIHCGDEILELTQRFGNVVTLDTLLTCLLIQ
jgi:hypothetical protein